MPTIQRKLLLNDKPSLVLGTVSTARERLPGHDEDDIQDLIDNGFIAFAWNIGVVRSPESRTSKVKGEWTPRRLIRIWNDCVDYYARTGAKSYPSTEDEILSQLFPSRHDNDFVTSKRLALIFNCGGTHIIQLIEAKQLSVVPGTSWGVGRNGAALIPIKSVTAFLKSRREGFHA